MAKDKDKYLIDSYTFSDRKTLSDKRKGNCLADLINALPTSDIGSADLKSLVLQLILDTPSDSSESHWAVRSKVKLEALKLLMDINRNESVGDYEADLLKLLEEDDKED